MNKAHLRSFVAAIVFLSTLCFAADPEALKQALVSNRHTLLVKNGELSGDGADVIRAALPGTQYLLLGEDHGTAEVPQLATALYRSFQPQGCNTLAVEVGPFVAKELNGILQKPNPKTAIADFVRQYPFALAFYNWNEEDDFLIDAARLSSAKLHLVGLDQELMGSGKYLLEQVAKEHPTGDALLQLQALQKKEAETYADASTQGDPTKLFMMTADENQISDLAAALRKQGKSDEPLQAMLASRNVYSQYFTNGFQSNVIRAALMKKNFVSQMRPDTKAMFKFGANHMFRGANTLRNFDIGNMLSELAASHGAKSLHVLALEAKGKQAAFGGIGKPSMVVDAEAGKDDFPELKPLFELADANSSAGWSLFDMRAIRGSYKKLGLQAELERVAVGYDLVVIIPVSTASSDVGLTLKP